MTKKQIAMTAARDVLTRQAKGELPPNAFHSVRPRGTGAPTHTPPAKRGPKSSKGTGLVLNIKGQRQAPLVGAGPFKDLPTLQQWKEGIDRTRKIAKAGI